MLLTYHQINRFETRAFFIFNYMREELLSYQIMRCWAIVIPTVITPAGAQLGVHKKLNQSYLKPLV